MLKLSDEKKNAVGVCLCFFLHPKKSKQIHMMRHGAIEITKYLSDYLHKQINTPPKKETHRNTNLACV